MKNILTILFLFVAQLSYSQTTISDVSYPFGQGFWNVYCFNGNSSKNTAVYAGYYTENGFSFDSKLRYPYSGNADAVPSNANSLTGNAYIGNIVGTISTVVYKRYGFPSGYYQLDIPALDDIGYLFINGIEVWNFQACCQSHMNVWKGVLDNTSTIEFEYINLASGGCGSMKATPVVDLPVSFVRFEAHATASNIQLEWVTVSEINNSLFTIEKSINMVDFKEVVAIRGSGNSNDITSYQMIDQQPTVGLSYYRIKQTDYDGKNNYSNILSMNYYPIPAGISIYPNPSVYSETICVALPFNGEILITISDMLGHKYYSKEVSNVCNNILSINPESSLLPGIYIIAISSGDCTYCKLQIIK